MPAAGGTYQGERRRGRIHVEGIVQGVGFRPFVHSLANRLGLAGFVANDPAGVTIEVEGGGAEIAEFISTIHNGAPPLAVVEHVAYEDAPSRGERTFEIVHSRDAGDRRALISPDIATCADCLCEIFDPADRRFRYAFTNCTNCGPRFTIVRGVPYDRPLTTIAAFAMCADCAREYHDPSNRRFHAQPNSCPKCGPRLRLIDRDRAELPGDPIETTAGLLRAGHIVAVKGLGGYHLAAAAENETAVAALRSRKHREDKPFALMAPDLECVRRLVELDDVEERLLCGPRRPIILLTRRADARIAASVAGVNRHLGLMLPYTPIHHLLCRNFGAPLVMTSGNASDEPIAYEDEDALRRLAPIADFFLTHDRPIHVRADDSVVRVFDRRPLHVRRSRGYAPEPLRLAMSFPRPILGCGGELKNTFCLGRGNHAFMSHHIGDLENYETLRAFIDGIAHFRRLFGIEPEVVACDLHPEYLSTKYAHELEGVEIVPVQHHHAHIASCLADNGRPGPAIGVAFDGLGYGTDGTLWGGEFLLADLADFERVGAFTAVPMPGGAAAIKQPWRMAAAYLDVACGDEVAADLAVIRRNRRHWSAIVRMARTRLNSPETSSVGRLFDAVAAILGIRDTVNYEGQAAIELERQASPSERGAYPVKLERGPLLLAPGADIIRAVIDDLRAGRDVGTIAARFHNTIAQVVADVCEAIRDVRGLSLVALSGGVFQNELLLSRAVQELRRRGFEVLIHSRVPPNDGGLSLGQIAAASMQRD